MATGVFSHSTLQNLVDQLAEDVADSGKSFFTATELQRTAVESLRLSNALTARSRGQIQFQTTPGTAWYDLAALGNGPTILAPTVTDRTTIENMQYRLMETVEPSSGAGMKEQHSFAELLRSLQQARDRFLVDTSHTVTRRSPQTITTTDGTVQIDEAIAKILRIVWIDELGRRTVLRNSTDEGTMTAVQVQRRLSTGTPRRWSVVASPQLQIQLDPIPMDLPGALSVQLTTIESGAALSTTANSNAGTVLGIHDDVAVGPMWDALELALSKNAMGADMQRSQLAARLGTFYRAIAAALPTVLEVRVNGVDIRIGTARTLDAKEPGWEGQINTRRTPSRAVIMGDWLGLYPVPDDAFAVDVTVVAKLPTLALSDPVQIGREHLSGIRAWAKQLLLFKVGGQPLQQAASVAGLLIEQAREFNEARTATCQYLSEFLSQGMDSPPVLPRSTPPPDLSGDPRDDASSRNTRQRSTDYNPYVRPIGGQ